MTPGAITVARIVLSCLFLGSVGLGRLCWARALRNRKPGVEPERAASLASYTDRGRTYYKRFIILYLFAVILGVLLLITYA